LFRPFIVSWSGSTTEIAGSHLLALGYQAPKAFGLSFTAGPYNLTKHQEKDVRPTAQLVDNTFENFEYGFYSYEADDVVVVGNEFRNNLIYAVDPHDRTERLLFAYNSTYGTAVKHGVIGSREVNNSYIFGNLSFDNAGSGFMLDRSSVGSVFYGNLAFRNHQDGFSMFESACNLIAANQVWANERAGIKVRNSWDIAIYHNSLVANAATAIEGYVLDLRNSPGSEARDFEQDPYEPITTFAAGWNLIERNGGGMSMAGVTGATLISNTFKFASRKLIGGDVANATMMILQRSEGIVVTSECRPRPPAAHCPLRDRGILGDELFESFFDEGATGNCTAVEGTAQARAFSNIQDGS
jgi:poly(beta-D-mannuronate) C5 epimerase